MTWKFRKSWYEVIQIAGIHKFSTDIRILRKYRVEIKIPLIGMRFYSNAL